MWGEYLYNALPNWAAKFFIDALLEKRSVLANIADRPRGRWDVPPNVPRALFGVTHAGIQSVRVVMYTTRTSQKIPQMLSRWSEWGFRPTAVVFERARAASPVERIMATIREEGGRGFVSRVTSRARGRVVGESEPGGGPVDALTFCLAQGIPCREVATLDSPAGRAVVENLRPDLAVHAGAGILRAPLLAIPRLGTINAHMGVLPYYRGMNVTEWARFNGDPVGCSVHLVDAGIDTGPILCVRLLDAESARSLSELRRLVDDAQIALLGETIRFVLRSGSLPP